MAVFFRLYKPNVEPNHCLLLLYIKTFIEEILLRPYCDKEIGYPAYIFNLRIAVINFKD